MKAEFDRHLAAVLALDIVGFSRLMEADEQRTLARLIARRDTAIDPAMHAHRGRIVKGTGDGILATFVSAQEAIRAALEARAGLDAANLAEPDEPPMLVRIGINIGDILFEEDGDIFGDGVNIAARLEATAPPGGICVSGRALDDLRRVGVPYSDLGEVALKNIAGPVRVLCIEPAGTPRAAPRGAAPRRRRRLRWPVLAVALAAVLAVAGWAAWQWSAPAAGHSVVYVEQFAAPAGDAHARALGDNLSAELARMVVSGDANVRVADAGSRPRRASDYLLSGNARRDGGELVLAIRLTGNGDDGILWSSEVRRPAGERDALRAQAVTRIADVLTCALGSAKTPRDRLPLSSLRLFLAGCEVRNTDWQAAPKYFRQVTEQVPDLAEPWGYFAVSLAEKANNVEGGDEAMRVEADAAARRALALDPQTANAYFALLIVHPTMTNWPVKMAMVKKGLAIDPNNPELLSAQFYMLWSVGRLTEAMTPARRAAEQGPFAPLTVANLAEHLAYTGDRVGADALLADARDRWGHEPISEGARFQIAAWLGDPGAAAALLDDPAAMLGLSKTSRSGWLTLIDARRAGGTAAAAKAAATIRRLADMAGASAPPSFVPHLVLLGDIDGAFAVADRLPLLDTPVERFWFRGFMQRFRADPRFPRFAARQGITGAWRVSGRGPDFCRTETVEYDCGALTRQ